MSFQVADALNQPFDDGQFDLVWSMESGEHMPDKTKVSRGTASLSAGSDQQFFSLPSYRDFRGCENAPVFTLSQPKSLSLQTLLSYATAESSLVFRNVGSSC